MLYKHLYDYWFQPIFFILLETNQNILYSAVIGNLAWHIFLGWDMKICNYSCWKNVSKYQKGGFYILDIIISPFYLYWMFVNFNVIPCKCKNREENYE